jgi:hypothetical protein
MMSNSVVAGRTARCLQELPQLGIGMTPLVFWIVQRVSPLPSTEQRHVSALRT